MYSPIVRLPLSPGPLNINQRYLYRNLPPEGGRPGWGPNLKMSKLYRIKPQAKQRSRSLRRQMTGPEQRLWKSLRQRQIGNYKFRRQHPFGIYILDFVCLDARLVIEVDGGQHLESSEYDQSRTLWLEQQGFRVLRFWNNEVINNLDAVLNVIWRELCPDNSPPP